MLTPISTAAPSNQLFPRVEHSIKPLNTLQQGTAFPTHRFWSNFVLKNFEALYAHPYVLKVRIQDEFPRMSISHCNKKKFIYSEKNPERAKIYENPFYENLGFSAHDFNSKDTSKPELISFDNFSVKLRFTVARSKQSIEFPVVQGMSYVTAKYTELKPFIYTEHKVTEVNGTNVEDAGICVISKTFEIKLDNGQIWMLYYLGKEDLSFQCFPTKLLSNIVVSGVLRLAVLPINANDECRNLLQKHCSVYPVGCSLSCHASSYTGKYSFHWKSEGDGVELLHYAFPHHQDIILDGTKAKRHCGHHVMETTLELPSTTKGLMKAYIGNSWDMIEDSLSSITWLAPRDPDEYMLKQIDAQLTLDLKDMHDGLKTWKPTDMGQNYEAGKILQKISQLCLVADYLSRAPEREDAVKLLKKYFQQFIDGKNKRPLKYDTVWGGVLSNIGPKVEDLRADYGNAKYNDHHFHWGYFIFAAATIRRFDPGWGKDNEEWVNTLVRDVLNPSDEDKYFPTFRHFDWFAGHCWAHGITPTTSGKDEESTSEEVNLYYAVKLWGLVTGNGVLENLGNLLLAVGRRSIQKYFLMDDSNAVHPPEFVGNKVTGKYFENKCEYNTWFDERPECIHGIQMIPASPIMEYVRTNEFISQEWRLLKDVATASTDGWKSILYMNYASLDKNEAFNVLLNAPKQAFDPGASRTWSLYYSSTRPVDKIY